MPRLLYITADEIGTPTGGGAVTFNELEALKTLGTVRVVRPRTPPTVAPFQQDEDVLDQVTKIWKEDGLDCYPELAHVYAGCFEKTCRYLKGKDVKVTYTVAAHDVNKSREAHAKYGCDFPYPHLTDPTLFNQYIGGYVLHADLVICPSTYSQVTVQSQGRHRDVVVIEHGHTPCDRPLRKTREGQPFTVGYLGAIGPDKGVPTLIQAWKLFQDQWQGRNEARLLLAGRYSHHMALDKWCRECGATNVFGLGWLDDPYDFYDALDVYVQPSNTEGFGIEVIEALSRGVRTLCSTGAGACELLPRDDRFSPYAVHDLASKLFKIAEGETGVQPVPVNDLTWERVRARYQRTWRSLLEPKTVTAPNNHHSLFSCSGSIFHGA